MRVLLLTFLHTFPSHLIRIETVLCLGSTHWGHSLRFPSYRKGTRKSHLSV
jgi:hypothetical protein